MSIFSEENKMGTQWFKFTNIGDSLEGTVIAIGKQINRLTGLEQTVYDILTEEGQVWKYGSKPMVDKMLNRIRPVRLGQIVGLKFTEKRPSKEIGKSPTNIIEVYVNPNIVNETWLKEYNSALAEQAVSSVETSTDADWGDTDVASTDNEEQDEFPLSTKLVKESRILELAKEKLNGVTSENVKSKVMSVTRLAYSESNYDKILTTLESM